MKLVEMHKLGQPLASTPVILKQGEISAPGVKALLHKSSDVNQGHFLLLLRSYDGFQVQEHVGGISMVEYAPALIELPVVSAMQVQSGCEVVGGVCKSNPSHLPLAIVAAHVPIHGTMYGKVVYIFQRGGNACRPILSIHRGNGCNPPDPEIEVKGLPGIIGVVGQTIKTGSHADSLSSPGMTNQHNALHIDLFVKQ